MKKAFVIGLGVFAIAGTTACSNNNSTPLKAPEGPAAATTVASVAGVTVDAEVDVWPGRDDVLSEVTPVRVTINNQSDQPISFQYQNFELVAFDGTVYHALPPFQIEGSVDRAAAVYDPIPAPGFTHDGFQVAPYYSSVYPGIAPHSSFGTYDPVYYDNYYRVWYDVELPTTEMIVRALPEGVIGQGGRLSGFLYFERVDSEKQGVVFRAKVVGASTEEPVGIVEIPFDVE